MANPFYVQPVNPLEALMAGQQGYDTARKRADQNMLSSIGDEITSGNIDYKQAAAKAIKAGNLTAGLGLLKLGEEQSASDKFSSYFGGGGAPQDGGGLSALMAPTRPQPSISPVASQPMPQASVQPQGPVQQATEGIVSAVTEDGRDIAPGVNAAGARVAQAQPQSQPQFQAPQITPNPAGGNVQALMAAVSNPRLGEGPRAAAKVMLEHALKSGDLPEDQKNYAFYRQQGGGDDFTTWYRKNKQASATAITNDMRGENAFEAEFGKKQADRWGGYITAADNAGKSLVDINNMREISRRLGTQGKAAQVKETLGPYADALGIKIDGLDDIQAFSSIIQRLAPQQRAPGSGSTSDIEFKGFLKSLPALSQNPAAREMTLDTMEALARHNIAEGNISSRLATKEINRGQAEKELRALPDPMGGYRAWRKENQGALSGSGQGGGPARPSTKQEYDALQPGESYVHPDGSLRTKQ